MSEGTTAGAAGTHRTAPGPGHGPGGVPAAIALSQQASETPPETRNWRSCPTAGTGIARAFPAMPVALIGGGQ